MVHQSENAKQVLEMIKFQDLSSDDLELLSGKLNEISKQSWKRGLRSNLGNGNGFSVKEVIQQVRKITRKDFMVKEEGRRDGDPSVLIASNKKAKKELDLSSDYTTLESIIKTLS